MALIHCRKCTTEMSDTDKVCPICGAGPATLPRDERVGWSRLPPIVTFLTIGGVLLLTFLFLLLFEAFRSAACAIQVASPDLTPTQKASLIALMLVIAGLGTFVRQNYRHVYGMTEVAFAIAFAWRVLGRDFQPDALANVVVLFSLIYLAGRGMANIVDGTKWRPKTWGEAVRPPFVDALGRRWRGRLSDEEGP